MANNIEAQIAALKADFDNFRDRVEPKVDRLYDDSLRAQGSQRVLMWLGAAVIAAAGGMGAFVAKFLGWITIR